MRQQFDHMLKLMGIRRPTRGAKANGDPCARYETLLSSYTDGMLDERKTALVEGHLNACASCRASLAATRLISGSLAHKPAPSLTGDMSARLRLALAAERERMPKHVPIFTGPRIAAMGVAACTVLAFALTINHGKHDQTIATNPNQSSPNNQANRIATNPPVVHQFGSTPIITEPGYIAQPPDVTDDAAILGTSGPVNLPTPNVQAPLVSSPKPGQTIAFHSQIPQSNRSNGVVSPPDVPALETPQQPSPAPPSVATNNMPPPPPTVEAPAPPPAAQAPQPTLVAAMPPSPMPSDVSTRPARLMLASSVHLADQDGGESSKVGIKRELRIEQGSGTFNMVASDFH